MKRWILKLSGCLSVFLAAAAFLLPLAASAAGSGSLTVYYEDPDRMGGYREELSGMDLVIDAFQISTGLPGRSGFAFLDGFDDLSLPADPKASDYEALSRAAFLGMLDSGRTPDASVSDGETISGAPEGLYLLCVRGSGKLADYADTSGNPGTVIRANGKAYAFAPEVAAIEAGKDRSAMFKPDLLIEEGAVRLKKTMHADEGGTYTAVFRISYKDFDGTERIRFETFQFDGFGTKEAVITGIPLGATVTAEEVFSPGYGSGDGDLKTATAGSVSNPTEISFVNYRRSGNQSGYGIRNLFRMESGGWTCVPDRR